MANTKFIGDIGENIAAEYLKSNGYEILERNAVYGGCEVDILCACYTSLDGSIVPVKKQSGLVKFLKRMFKLPNEKVDGVYTYVFCEVKTRFDDSFGSGAEAVDAYKKGRYVTAAKYYLMGIDKIGANVRFDVIEVSEDGEINHIENAFTESEAKYRH